MTDAVIPIPVSGGLSGLGQDAAGLNSILGLLFGNKTNTTTNIGGTTTTEGNIVDPAVITETIRSMLEGNGSTSGLASLLSAQTAAGGYGGNTANLQVNDLVSRIAGAVAKVTATNVKTTSGSTNSTTTGTDGKAKDAAALAALMAALKGMSKGSGKDSGGKGGGGGGGSGNSNSPTNMSENKDQAANLANGLTDTMKEIETEPEGPTPSDAQVMENILNDTPAPPDVQFDDVNSGDGNEFDSGDYTGGEIPDTGDTGDGGGDNTSEGGDTGDNSGDGGDDSGDFTGDDGEDLGGDDGGCYITTAVVHASGLPDNCIQLEIMRKWRDSWMNSQHPEAIMRYYDTAPKAVTKINSRSDSKELYSYLYVTYILPTICYIIFLEPVEAYKKYTAMLDWIQEFVVGKEN